jgi:hypothetical protein
MTKGKATGFAIGNPVTGRDDLRDEELSIARSGNRSKNYREDGWSYSYGIDPTRGERNNF